MAVNPADAGQVDHGWILTNDNREECVIVSFETAVFINEIHVYESLNPGCVVKLEMLESERSKRISLKRDCEFKLDALMIV